MTGIRSSSEARTSWVATSGFQANPEQCIYKNEDSQDQRIAGKFNRAVSNYRKTTYSVAVVADFNDQVVLAEVPH